MDSKAKEKIEEDESNGTFASGIMSLKNLMNTQPLMKFYTDSSQHPDWIKL